MKQITDRDGDPRVFLVGHDEGGLWLYRGIAGPDYEWILEREILFRYRKLDSLSSSASDSLKITFIETKRVIIQHDGLLVAEDSLEKAIISYGEGMFDRGKNK